ncbi:non-specific lipid transfer protein GPI-anchored 1 [Euphorbia lathyris]|uniref:non-specific lipid transfer protein GPI-anchored 1 n=1 Tax=Euphorbia lathyris TaxID=212925 RepID=UPI0033140A1B
MSTQFQSVLFLAITCLLCLNLSVEGQSAVPAECSSQIQKVMPCLTYATGKAAAPTPDCCKSVKEIKESEPKCLCMIMQQTHNGSAEIKSLGIQEDKLLQLPSACKFQNASISFCIKELGLAPNSPDAAIFTSNASTTPTAPARTGTGTGTAAPEKTDNNGIKQKPLYFPTFVAIAFAVFISTFCA